LLFSMDLVMAISTRLPRHWAAWLDALSSDTDSWIQTKIVQLPYLPYLKTLNKLIRYLLIRYRILSLNNLIPV
jgi:hypothetical protein